MNFQDGSDERTSSSSGSGATSNEPAQSFPCVMSLRLLDSKDGPVASQLAPFAKSYDEAVLHALGAFPKHILPGTNKSTISLKHPCKALDGTVYWPGLQVAKDSREIWMRLMTPTVSERIPEIGVSVDDEAQSAASVPVPMPVAQPNRPFTGKNGVELKMCMYDKKKLHWVSGSQGNPSPIPPPLRYQECVELVAQRMEALFTSDHPQQKGDRLRVLLQLKIWDPSAETANPLNENHYREKMQGCAYDKYERSVEDYVEIYIHYNEH